LPQSGYFAHDCQRHTIKVFSEIVYTLTTI
jgi:hypothetical protein